MSNKRYEVQWYKVTIFETDDVLIADRYKFLMEEQGKTNINIEEVTYV